jgi:hypothetical protein
MRHICKDDSDINITSKRGKTTLTINVPYMKDVDHRKLHSGPKRIHIILRNWNINFHST